MVCGNLFGDNERLRVDYPDQVELCHESCWGAD
jgi:hypothetical protein